VGGLVNVLSLPSVFPARLPKKGQIVTVHEVRSSLVPRGGVTGLPPPINEHLLHLSVSRIHHAYCEGSGAGTTVGMN
jgi:hypothetical protein